MRDSHSSREKEQKVCLSIAMGLIILSTCIPMPKFLGQGWYSEYQKAKSKEIHHNAEAHSHVYIMSVVAQIAEL
jgi:hypothetical protein